MAQIIFKYNKAHLAPSNPNNQILNNKRKCNCRSTSSCPLDGNCMEESLVYQAKLTQTTTGSESTYMDLLPTLLRLVSMDRGAQSSIPNIEMRPP